MQPSDSRPPADPDAAPPRVATRLVRWAARSWSWRETAAGDLAEEHFALARDRGRLVAGVWYWGQALVLLAAAAGRSLSGAGRAVASLLFIGDRPMHTLAQEIRFGLRSLARNPLVTGAIVLTLALGLGANAAAFSMLDALVLRPFNLTSVDRLAVVSEWSERDPFPRQSVSPANFLDWKAQATSFDRMAVFSWWQVNLAGGDEPERVQGFRVSADFFSAFEQTPLAGRFIDDADMQTGRKVVVLSESLWKRRFGGRPDIVGKSVKIDGEQYDVVGIAPPKFDIPLGSVLWGVWSPAPEERDSRRSRDLTVIARLAPGRTLEGASSEMQVIGERLLQQHPRDNEGYEVRTQSFTQGMIDPGMDQILGMIQIGALLVLAIGGANIANLLLARGADRQREIALRLAIGAGRARILRQLLVESAVLAAVAVPVSLAFAAGSLRLLKSAMPARTLPFVPGWAEIDVDGRLGLVIIGAALLASIAFSVVPALQSSRPNLVASLKEGGRSVAGGGSRRRLLRGALVIGQIALAVPLLSATGLTVGASDQFAHGPQGYDPDGVVTLRTVLPEATYAEADARRQFAERLLDETSRLPGVEAAATASFVPSGDSSSSREIVIDGQPDDGAGRRPIAPYRAVSARYFETMRIPMVAGRSFSASDTEDVAPVVIVSQALASQLFGAENPLGRRLRIAEAEDKRWMTVVGVAGNIIDDWFDRRNGPMLYVAMPQRPSYIVNLVARAGGDPALLATSLRQALRTVDPAQPPVHVMTMRAMVNDRTIGLRMIGAMMGVLGLLALALASIGLYSLMSYQVTQRRHEIGVRMALGASRGGVVRLTIRRAGWLTIGGLVAGLALALPLANLIRSVMFGVVTPGVTLYATIVSVVAAIAMAASVIPARQAARVEPVVALRAE
jgi:putative ABC transport system permease protein